MEHKRKLIAPLILAVLVWVIVIFTGEKDPIDLAADALEIDLPRGQVLVTEETHGGFHGDGHTYIVIRFEEDISDRLTGEYWHSLPMSENVSTVFYGRETETMNYRAHLSGGEYGLGDPILPEISNGRYYFRDRNSQATDPADDSALFVPGRSFNYTAAVYDGDTCTLYYFKFDT